MCAAGMVITLTQKKAKNMRILTIVFEVTVVAYYAAILSPTNVAVEGFVLISAIVGYVRHDVLPYKNEEKACRIIEKVLIKSLD